MKLEPYEVNIPEGRESEGYVHLRHNTQYTLALSNHGYTRCDAEVRIDGRSVGVWRVPALKTVVLERPVHDKGRFTFYEVGSREADKAGISESDQLGLLTVVFTPEITVQMMSAPYVQGGHAGGTGLSGQSNQEFSNAASIEYDDAKAVTIHLRLVGEPDEPRPMFQRETAVPQPVAPRDAKRPSNNPANSQQDDEYDKQSPEQMQETKRRIRLEIHDEVIAEQMANLNFDAMTHSDFLELRREKKIRMGIDKSKALWLIELLPLRYQYLLHLCSWAIFLSVPGAFVVWYFFAWYWGLFCLFIVTPAIFRYYKTSAAQCVMQHAENDPLFFDHLMNKGLLTVAF